MGSLFKPKFRHNPAGPWEESAIWWAKFRDGLGVLRRESTGTEKKAEAVRFLRQHEGASSEGRIVVPRVEKVTVAQLADAISNDYIVNHRRSIDRLDDELGHVLSVLGPLPAIRVTTADVTDYVARRLDAGAKPSTVNKELAALKRMYSLAIKAGRLHHRPHIPTLQEDNARTGFFEPDQLAAVLRHLPEYVRGPVVFASITGWRKEEVLGLEWSRVNFREGTVRLDPAQSKNRRGRVFPFTPELRHLLEEQRRLTNALQQEQGRNHPLRLPPEGCAPAVLHEVVGESLRRRRRAWTPLPRSAPHPPSAP